MGLCSHQMPSSTCLSSFPTAVVDILFFFLKEIPPTNLKKKRKIKTSHTVLISSPPPHVFSVISRYNPRWLCSFSRQWIRDRRRNVVDTLTLNIEKKKEKKNEMHLQVSIQLKTGPHIYILPAPVGEGGGLVYVYSWAWVGTHYKNHSVSSLLLAKPENHWQTSS